MGLESFGVFEMTFDRMDASLKVFLNPLSFDLISVYKIPITCHPIIRIIRWFIDRKKNHRKSLGGR